MSTHEVRFRWSNEADLPAVHELHCEAFGRVGEAGLAVALIDSDVETLSLVADFDGDIVGHVLLSALGGPVRALALAPLAVAPGVRRFGIGSELMRLAILRSGELEWKSIFVLGEPSYYERFGFRSETADGAICEWQGPYLMAVELEADALKDFSGPIRYAEPFHDL